MPARPIICVFGSYEPKPGEPLFELAYNIGFQLARAGFDICNGGYIGTMLASAKGAKDAGGATIGATCNIFKSSTGVASKPNPYIDRELTHDHLLPRIQTMMELGAGYVVLPGGTGTLAEFSIIWEFVCKEFITPRPIFLVGDFWKPVVTPILSVRPKHCRHVQFAETAEDIATRAVELLNRSR